MNLAETLNLGCACTTLRADLLPAALEKSPELQGLAAALPTSHPHLFSASPVFMGSGDAATIARAVEALHRVARLPGFQARVLAHAPAIAQCDPGAAGAFMGYDFHLGDHGPRLIEINTNAGGALLHAAALMAHRDCCEPAVPSSHLLAAARRLDAALVEMFRQEWQAQRGTAPLRRVAIVDDDPSRQYLAPEFELARQLFLAHGIDAVVADAADLRFEAGVLGHDDRPIDLVYNRLTDFALEEPRHRALRDAYLQRAAVVTPHPHAHAVHADKRNLVILSDNEALAQCGASASDQALLAQVVPTTLAVTPTNADGLWARRRQLFFKPATGYGSKAAYRGDKLTRRVWDDILGGRFVAQELVPPSERVVPLVDGSASRLRLDVRAYAYRGQVLLLAARTYAGQTTNFRTPGGGFAPIVVLPDLPSRADCGCTE
jgi:hypothetical protein